MKRIRTIIVEDEQILVESLEKMIEEFCPEVDLIGRANNIADAKTLITTLSPELLLLDIRLNGELIFDLLQEIYPENTEIIFITAYQEYAIHAIKCSALDYLLKPLQPGDLQKAINRVSNKIHQSLVARKQINNLLAILEGKREQYIALPLMKEIRFVSPHDIIRLEAQNNYTLFFLLHDHKIMVSKGLFEFKELLIPFGFIDVHKAHLVNRTCIQSLVREDGVPELVLKDKTRIPVSRLKMEEVKFALTSGSMFPKPSNF